MCPALISFNCRPELALLNVGKCFAECKFGLVSSMARHRAAEVGYTARVSLAGDVLLELIFLMPM